MHEKFQDCMINAHLKGFTLAEITVGWVKDIIDSIQFVILTITIRSFDV